MKPYVISSKFLASLAKDRFKKQFQKVIETNPTWRFVDGSDPKEKLASLEKLGENVTVEHIKELLGIVWVTVMCDACDKMAERAVDVGSEQKQVTLCKRCLLEALYSLGGSDE